MRQTLSRGVFAAAAATGILSLSCSSALADSDAAGVTSDSSGLAAGNTVQVPVDAPVNLCGNTVGAATALNGAFGNACANDACASEDDAPDSSYGSSDSSYGDSDDATDEDTSGSQASDDCATPPHAVTHPVTPPPTRSSETPPRAVTPPTQSRHTQPPAADEQAGDPPQLAHTGNAEMLATSAASVVLITGGVMLYRRGRAASQR